MFGRNVTASDTELFTQMSKILDNIQLMTLMKIEDAGGGRVMKNSQ